MVEICRDAFLRWVDAACRHILDFLERKNLNGLDFLDIGCGSGRHSLAAFLAGAERLCSFDYDPNSVAATEQLHETVGGSGNWTVERGDALNKDYIASLGKWNCVYSLGVLHHTSDVWSAIDNVQSTVDKNGIF